MLAKVVRNMLAKVVRDMLAKMVLVAVMASYCYHSINAKYLDTDPCPTNDCTLIPQLCHLKRNVNELTNRTNDIQIELTNRTKDIQTNVSELFVRGRKIAEDVNKIRNSERSLKIRLAKLEKENSTMKQKLQLIKEENSDLKTQIQSMKRRQETNEAALRKLTDVTLAILKNQTLFNKAENTQQQNEIENIRSQLENTTDVKNIGK